MGYMKIPQCQNQHHFKLSREIKNLKKKKTIKERSKLSLLTLSYRIWVEKQLKKPKVNEIERYNVESFPKPFQQNHNTNVIRFSSLQMLSLSFTKIEPK